MYQRSTETLSRELGLSLTELRRTMKRVCRLVHQLEQHADFVAAIAAGRPVVVRAKKLPVAGRTRGRPKGATNNVTIFATPGAVARLRRELPR